MINHVRLTSDAFTDADSIGIAKGGRNADLLSLKMAATPESWSEQDAFGAYSPAKAIGANP